jgi:actin
MDKTIVVDSCSMMCKSGFSGNDAPISIFPSVIAREKYGDKNEFFGYEALKRRGLCPIFHPIENGIIKNYDYMENLWSFIFNNELKIKTEGNFK